MYDVKHLCKLLATLNKPLSTAASDDFFSVPELPFEKDLLPFDTFLCFQFMPHDDAFIEGRESVVLELRTSQPETVILDPAQVEIFIEDDEEGKIAEHEVAQVYIMCVHR